MTELISIKTVDEWEVRPLVEDATLFLFSRAFPFGAGEVFLEAELEYLARSFTTIVLQPLQKNGEPRPVPSNVDVRPPLWGEASERRDFFVKNLTRPTLYRQYAADAFEFLRGRRPDEPILPSLQKLLHWAVYREELATSDTVREAIALSRPKVAYAYWGHIPALGLSRLADLGVPTAARFHRVDLYRDASAASAPKWSRSPYMPWFETLSERLDALFFISEHGRSYFRHSFSGMRRDPDNLIVSRLGVGDRGVTPDRVRDDAPVVLASCSRIASVKRVHLIAALVGELAKRLPLHWHHFGAGECATTAEAVRSIDPGRATVTFHGQTHNADLRRFYSENRIDLFVNFSSSEGIPVSIMEALSANIPVLATPVNGTPEAVINDVSGYLCREEELSDMNSLSARVVDIIQSGRLSFLNPRQVWSERFNAETNYTNLCNYLLSLAARDRLPKGVT